MIMLRNRKTDSTDVRTSYIDCYAPFTERRVGVALKRSLVTSATAFSVRIQSRHPVLQASAPSIYHRRHHPSLAAGNLYLHPRLIWRQVESRGRQRRRIARITMRVLIMLRRITNRSEINGLPCLPVPPRHPIMVMR